MAGVKGMHKKAQITKDSMLTVTHSSGNGRELHINSVVEKNPESAQEEKFLSEVLAGYSYWNKQQGDRAKAYAAAYKTLLNEFTAEEIEK